MKEPRAGGMDADQFRQAASAAIEEVISYFSSLPTRRVLPAISPGYLAPQLPTHAPEQPEPWPTIQPDIDAKIVPGLTHWQSPNFMAFFPATVTYPSILGEIYSAAFTAPAFNWLCSPACTELETVVLDWVARMLGLPDAFLSSGDGGGVIQGSASEACVVAMVAARDRCVRDALEKEGLGAPDVPGEEDASVTLRREDRAMELRSRLVALGSEQSHSSTQKAANILGVRYRAVRAGRETAYVMTGANLRRKVEELEAQGLVPFYVTATLGTTATCAVDDFEGIAEVRRQHAGLWVHVDAAYAGAALVCEEYREGAGARWFDEVDSFDMNLHKWLLVNFDASCMFVRSRATLTTALSITPSYLLNPTAISGLVTDYRDWQIPLGRRFRALKVWFVLRSYGVASLRGMVRRHVALGEYFAGERLVGGVEGRARFEVLAGSRFALTVVRCKLPPAASSGDVVVVTDGGVRGVGDADAELNGHGDAAVVEEARQSLASGAENALTKKVYETVNRAGEVFLTSSVIDGTYAIRVVSANELAEEKYVRKAFEELVKAYDLVVKEDL